MPKKANYLIRLDDACEYMDLLNWGKLEDLLDSYNIKPIVGIIPMCQDDMFISAYGFDEKFWERALRWQKKGWTIALHGHTHVYAANSGGINPVNKRSEFAGVPLEDQKIKIKEGYNILKSHGLEAAVFFAPAHTFDKNTLIALREETDIRIISDTIANDIYMKDGFHFIPQQSGKMRKLRFATSTFCIHPNSLNTDEYNGIEEFLEQNFKLFCSTGDIDMPNRSYSFYDYVLSRLYFAKRAFSGMIRKIYG